jgi:succinyl-diaminopimelate desuccinylase
VLRNREQIAALGLSIDATEVAELAASLIRIPTVPGLYPEGEAEAVACLGEVLDREHIRYDVEEVRPGRPNLVIEMGHRAGPSLWLNGHLDTVPIGNRLHWRHEPFGGDEVEGLLYGRGASDCKGGVAAMIHAVIALKRAGARIRGRLIFSAVMGEEEGQIGMRHLLDRGMRADAFVSTQWSTVGRVAISYRGVCWLEVTTTGRSAHGSRPIEGVNAVEEMVSLVWPRLKNIRLPIDAEDPSVGPFVNLAAVNGGDVANVVPDTCRALLDYRITPGQRTETLLQEIERTLDELRLQHPSLVVAARVILRVEPTETVPDSRLVRVLGDAIQLVTGNPPVLFGKTGTGDANLVHERLGIPAIAYGPGNDSGHRPDEYVAVQDLVSVAETYALLALKFHEAA